MKLVSWNVNGIRACITKGFEESFAKLDADIFCLQETKCQENQVKLELPGYHQYWNYANRKGYSGTAVFTKKEPLSVTYGIGIEEHDKEGRVITARDGGFLSGDRVHAQFPVRASQAGIPHGMGAGFPCLSSEAAGEEACDLLRGHECGTPGDRSEEPQDQSDECRLHRSRSVPALPKCWKLDLSIPSGIFTRIWQGAYSWWSYRFKAREKNAGWRIDYFLTSPSLKEKLEDAKIHSDIMGSDHCPVELDLKF